MDTAKQVDSRSGTNLLVESKINILNPNFKFGITSIYGKATINSKHDKLDLPEHNALNKLTAVITLADGTEKEYTGFLSVHDAKRLSCDEVNDNEEILNLLDLDASQHFRSEEDENGFCSTFLTDTSDLGDWFSTLILTEKGEAEYETHLTLSPRTCEIDPELQFKYELFAKLLNHLGLKIRGNLRIIIFNH